MATVTLALSMPLSERQERILAAVCRDYVVTGREVSSSALMRRHGFRCSSATIRQDLAGLEREGLVYRPHASAGCLPTRAGLQRYVGALPKSAPPRPELAALVDRGLRDIGQHIDSDLRVASCVLSEVAGCVAVTFWGASRTGVIAEIDVVQLVGPRALVVMTMDDRSTVMHPITFERHRTDDDYELRQLQERLRALCRGRTLPAARAELQERQTEGEAQFDRLLAEALRVGLTLCAGASLDPLWLQVAGQPILARGVSQVERLSEVLELLEDVHRLADVLCQLLPAPGRSDSVRAEVYVGFESRGAVEDAMNGITLIGCRLRAAGEDDGRTGAVALLGPDRLDYASVIPLVEYAARTLATR